MGSILSAILGVIREMAKKIREGRTPHSGLYVLLLMGLSVFWFFVCSGAYEYLGERMAARLGSEFPTFSEAFWWDWEKAIAPIVATIYLTILSFAALLPDGMQAVRRCAKQGLIALLAYVAVTRLFYGLVLIL